MDRDSAITGLLQTLLFYLLQFKTLKILQIAIVFFNREMFLCSPSNKKEAIQK